MTPEPKIFDWAATDREFPPIVGRGRGVPMVEPGMDLQDYIDCRRAIHQLPEVKTMPNEAKLPDVITADSIRHFVFGEYRKTATTRISEFTVPAGTPFETPEGLKAEDEECRVAFDAQGGVYPIRESIFRETYAPAEEASETSP